LVGRAPDLFFAYWLVDDDDGDDDDDVIRLTRAAHA
jgi:hypothetical protein